MAPTHHTKDGPGPSICAPAAPTRLRRRVLGWTLAAVTALASVPLVMLAAAAPASAATSFNPSQFHGVTWSRLGDNFTADPLVLQGLSASDDYNATRTKADAMFATF